MKITIDFDPSLVADDESCIQEQVLQGIAHEVPNWVWEKGRTYNKSIMVHRVNIGHWTIQA